MTLFNSSRSMEITMKEKILKFKEDIESMKKELHEYCTDNVSHSLEERWSAWRAAPDVLKEHDYCVVGFEYEKSLPDGEFDWMLDFYKGRYQTVVLSEIVDMMASKKKFKETLDLFKEEIMQKNIGSFVYDW